MIQNFDRYRVIKQLGEGSASKVYLVEDSGPSKESHGEKKKFALKLVDLKFKSNELVVTVLHEIRILTHVNHPCVIKLRKALVDSKHEHLGQILEYAPHGTLMEFIETHKAKNELIPERIIWKIAAQILLAIGALHKMHVVHGDIKSSNILIMSEKRMQVVLSDMNTAMPNEQKPSETVKVQCTPYFSR